MHDALARALAAGATVVTPNRRLARHLVDEYDRVQRAAGKLAWIAARALPWNAWITAMHDEAIAAGVLAPLVPLSPQGSALLWRAAVEADTPPVQDVAGLAASAAEAWTLVHGYGAGGEGWRAWSGSDDEPAAFARWAERYRSALAAHRATDTAVAAERVVQAADAMPSWRGGHVAFVGVVDPTPQQRRLEAALARAGMRVETLAALADLEASPRRAAFASPDAELAAALAWARGEAERRPEARIAVVVPDLAHRLAAVHLAAIDTFGRSDDDASATQAWNVSLGAPIDAVPLVASAIDLIALGWTTLPAGRAAALLRSVHLPDADGESRGARAAVERPWLESGVDFVRAGAVVAALEGRDPALARRLSTLRSLAARHRRATRHGWVDAWREALAAVGWPGDAALSSDDHQALAALDEHLVAFAALDAVSPGRTRGEIGAEEAVVAFAAILSASPFQPESPAAPIQILGLYESIGLPFDALWIAGMNDETLPRALRPHPLLPARWQREHGVPRSDAARELAYARDVVSWWLRAAPDVVVSHATTIEDRPATRAAVFPAGDAVVLFVPPSQAEMQFAARPVLERSTDALAPAVSEAIAERWRAGSGLVAAQSDCPFQALAARRWRADPWPDPVVGLTPMERGNLVHAALAAFWRETGDQPTLVSLVNAPPRFAAARARAAQEAIATIDAARWRRVPAVVRALEEDRLSRLLAEWLIEVELRRPPFATAFVEHEQTLAIGALSLALRLDRVDVLADGGAAIVDYKTGGVPAISRWTGDRPESTQLALYALAWLASRPETPVRATVLARVKRGDPKAVGLYADPGARFAVPKSSERTDPVVDWAALQASWRGTMTDLVDAFVRGEAQVAPRELSVCRTCARHALCRIRDAARDDDEVDA